ncbi:MAG: hypothetical protein WCT27_04315 [Patescibacteria group bacterium]|jgi:hypothetical protein
MKILKKISYLAGTVLLFGALLLWNSFHHLTYFVITSTLLLYALTVLILLARRIAWKEVLSFVAPSGLFLISSLIFFSLIDHPLVRVIFLILVTIGYFMELDNLYIYLYETEKYQPYALENVHGYVNLTSLYLLVSSLYGLLLYFNWPSWIVIIFVFFLTVFFAWRTLISYKVDKSKSRIYIFISGLLLAESALIVNFLPTSYLFNGLVLAIIYYFLINFLRDYLRDMLDKKALVKYSVISGSAMLISILTTRWF